MFTRESIGPRPPTSGGPPSRGSAGAAAYEPRRESGPRRGEAAIAFRGVLQKDGVFTAYLEDGNTGQISIVRVGDTVAQGKVAAITLDSLLYTTPGGRQVRVSTGQALDGSIATAYTGTPASPPSTSPTTGPSPSAPVASSAPGSAARGRPGERR